MAVRVSRAAPSMPNAGTRPEARLCDALRAIGVHGFEANPGDMPTADVYFRRIHPVAVCVDGCAFHGCPIHWRPHGNAEHGLSRRGVSLQRHKDRLRREAMQAKGIEVLSFWEHEVNADARKCARKIVEALKR